MGSSDCSFLVPINFLSSTWVSDTLESRISSNAVREPEEQGGEWNVTFRHSVATALSVFLFRSSLEAQFTCQSRTEFLFMIV
jgi:nucleoside recognition membrane protein YjiH